MRRQPTPMGQPAPALSLWFWGLLFAAMLFRAFPYGIAYFPVLDDNNMYGVFAHMGVGEVFRTYPDFIRTRPFAVLFDVLFISRLWQFPWLVQGVLSGMLCFTLWLVHRTSRALNMPLGAFGLVFLALDPFGMEATWWLAASSRIVVGFFLTVLSLWLLLPLIGRGVSEPRHPLRQGALYALVQLLSLGFYEQTMVLSTFVSGAVILFWAGTRKQRAWLAVPFVNAVLMGVYYLANAGAGNAAERGGLVRSGFRVHLSRTFEDVIRKLFRVHAELDAQTAKAGFTQAVTGMWGWLAIVALLSVGLVWAVIRLRGEPRESFGVVGKKALAGVLLVLVPLVPFLVLENNYMAHRNFYLSLLGLAYLLDIPAQALLGLRGWRWTTLAALFGMCLVFLFGSVSEVRDYKAVSDTDGRIARAFAEVLRDASGNVPGNETGNGAGNVQPRILLFNAKPRYPTLAWPHFSNATAADWAFMGLIRARETGAPLQTTTPVASGARLAEGVDLSECLLVGVEDSLAIEVLVAGAEMANGDLPLLRKGDGVLFGRLESREDGVWFVKD